MAHALVRPPSTRPSLGRSIVSRDENECASFGVSRDRRRRLPSPRATDPPSTDHPPSTQALEWTHGFSSALPDSVVNLSTPSSPTRRLAYVAAHTLVVHESDAAPSHADSSSARQFALRGHRSAIRSVRASDDRAVVVTAEAGPDAAVIVWDVHALRPRRTIEGRHPSGVAAADLTPCGRWYATLSDAEEAAPPYEQVVRVWDLHDAASDEPCFVGVTPAEVAHDKQTCVKFNPAAPRELVTNGRTGVAFFVPDDPETSETGRRAETDEETDEEMDVSSSRKKRAHRARLRAYAPPVRAGDLNQRVADFTSSAFVTCDGEASTGAEGAGRCVTGTAEGDLVVWMAGGVPPGGPGAFEARGMRAGDRRGVKIVRAHAHGAVTHLSVAGDVARTRRGETSALAPASPDADPADPADTYLVTGGSDGNVRFFDVELRLVAWFDGLDAGGVTSVSFVATETGPSGDFSANVEANVEANEAHDAVSAGRRELDLEKTNKAFTAPDFVVATNDSFVFALRSQDFETLGSDEAVARASLVARGAMEPAVALAAHPTDPVLCVAGLHGGVWTWNYATRAVVTHVDLTRGGVKPQSRPTCVAYRSDGLGVVVGTRGGELKALDAQTLAETQAMRFTPDAVTRVCCSDDPACAYAAAADKAGGVSLFRLLGPIHEPRDGADPARAFDFVGKHRTHAEATPCVGLAFVSSADGESVELASVGAEGRVARYDVEGSTAEDGVDVLEVSDVALGGEAAGGDARPTAAAFVKKTRRETRFFLSSRSSPSRDDSPSRASRTSDVGSESGSGSESESDSEDPHEPTLLVADDHLKLRLVDCETLTCVGVKCAPPYGDAPVTFLAPFGEKRDCFAYACARDVAGVGRLPADGDPAKSMGVVAHPGPVLALVVSEVVVDGDAAEDDGAARGSASARVFTLGGGGVGVGDGDDRGSVISVWRVDAAAARRLGDDASTMTSASFSKKKVEKSETVAARRTARLLEGGARGALAEAARDAFAFAQLRAQGEDATRDRAVDTRRGTVPVGEVAGLMRALGLYLTEREVNDVAVELRYEAELAGANVPTEVDFDRFLALYVNRRPPRDVGLEDVREAFEIILDGEGDAVSRESLIEMLKTSGEAMSDEELAAVAKALGGEEAGSVENLFPEAVTAKSFAENILGFRTVEE